jgi:hypothetical protein
MLEEKTTPKYLYKTHQQKWAKAQWKKYGELFQSAHTDCIQLDQANS